MSGIYSYSCKSCGAAVEYDFKSGEYRCGGCGARYSAKQLISGEGIIKKEGEDIDRCPSCFGTIGKSAEVSRCKYCSSLIFLKDEKQGAEGIARRALKTEEQKIAFLKSLFTKNGFSQKAAEKIRRCEITPFYLPYYEEEVKYRSQYRFLTPGKGENNLTCGNIEGEYTLAYPAYDCKQLKVKSADLKEQKNLIAVREFSYAAGRAAVGAPLEEYALERIGASQKAKIRYDHNDAYERFGNKLLREEIERNIRKKEGIGELTPLDFGAQVSFKNQKMIFLPCDIATYSCFFNKGTVIFDSTGEGIYRGKLPTGAKKKAVKAGMVLSVILSPIFFIISLVKLIAGKYISSAVFFLLILFCIIYSVTYFKRKNAR